MSISLVIVEDLEEVRENLQQLIEREPDFRVMDVYKTGEEALHYLPLLKPDIVIMDINLPGMNGIDCIRQLRSALSSTQFMMFTVYENDEKVFDALKAGASGYLLKTAGIKQIIEGLKDLYNGGSPMSSNIARKLVSVFRQQNREPEQMEELSKRENEILQLLAKGLLYKEIGEALHISVGTVRQHIHNIYAKLHVQNRTEAINKMAAKKL